MALMRGFACVTQIAASGIAGYRDVMPAETSVSFRADEHARAHTFELPIGEEPRGEATGRVACRPPEERYSRRSIAARLIDVYAAAGAR